ncbi:hypothetical protein RhiirA1_474087 [Rhizophagus irregularis]|uniref:Uncharacterized protein n=1 Tax=Rhizophagus irregularis TaxID=588596 RepID=A0A2N0QZ81_9GLOM|nr:hypothetical protein RhiirA1_474087 [Rhizophagus irregularis]
MGGRHCSVSIEARNSFLLSLESSHQDESNDINFIKIESLVMLKTGCFDISPNQFNRELSFSNILRIGTINVQSIVYSSKQLNLFSLIISHQLHGLILTETNLRSPAHKYVCEPYLSQFSYHKWFSFSPSVNYHAGIGIILHSSLAMYVIRKRFYKDQLISLFLQLPGRQNITDARSADAHVLLGGNLNAEFDGYLKNISDPTILSPINPLFRYLHSHQFDDLYSLDTFSSDHFLLIGFFDFLNIRDLRAPSYLKQRSRFRTEYNVYVALPEQKILFTAEVDSGLKKPAYSKGDGYLNQEWYQLKSTLLTAARRAFFKRIISLKKLQVVPFKLRPFIHLSQKLDHYISSLFKIFSISDLYFSWNRFFPSFCREFTDLFPDQSAFIDSLPIPTTLYSVFITLHLDFLTFLTKFRTFLRTIKRFISGKVTLEFDNHKQVAMKAAIAE